MGLSPSAQKPERIRGLHRSEAHFEENADPVDVLMASKGDALLDRYGSVWQPAMAFDRQLFPSIIHLESGGVGNAILYVQDESGNEFAVKRVEMRKNRGFAAKLEKDLLLAVDFPFVLQLYATYKDHAYVYFLLELTHCSCISDHMFQPYINEEVICFWAAQIVLAVEYLHSANIVHRDIKPENVLVFADGYIKLADFDQTLKLPPHRQFIGLCGTAGYSPPEVISNCVYSKGVDWWTVGLLNYELFFGQIEAECEEQELERLRNYGPGFNKTLDLDAGSAQTPISNAARNFISELLRVDPMFRLGVQYPGSSAVRKHSFFENIDFLRLVKKKIRSPVRPSETSARLLAIGGAKPLEFNENPVTSEIAEEYVEF